MVSDGKYCGRTCQEMGWNTGADEYSEGSDFYTSAYCRLYEEFLSTKYRKRSGKESLWAVRCHRCIEEFLYG